MKISDLRTLIRECIKEEFEDSGTMQTVNIREGKDEETQRVGAFGTANFFASEPQVVSLLNNTGNEVTMTVKKMGGGNFFVRLDG